MTPDRTILEFDTPLLASRCFVDLHRQLTSIYERVLWLNSYALCMGTIRSSSLLTWKSTRTSLSSSLFSDYIIAEAYRKND